MNVSRCQGRDDEDEQRGENLEVRIIRDHRTRQGHRELAQHDERFPRDDEAGTIRGVAVEKKGEASAHFHSRVLGVASPRADALTLPVRVSHEG